jgi:hypothetical protein
LTQKRVDTIPWENEKARLMKRADVITIVVKLLI